MNKDAKVSNPFDHVFYFDNFFTSFELMKRLTEQAVLVSGTVRINRTNKCPLSTEQTLKKEERGFCDYKFDNKNEIFVVGWKDNNNVKVLSNHQGDLITKKPTQKVKRWSRQKKEQVTLEQPMCIANHNKFMGGVDKMDWLLNKYWTKIRRKIWYFPIFTNMIDMTVEKCLHG